VEGKVSMERQDQDARKENKKASRKSATKKSGKPTKKKAATKKSNPTKKQKSAATKNLGKSTKKKAIKQTKGGPLPNLKHDTYLEYKTNIRPEALKNNKGKYCGVWYANKEYHHDFFSAKEEALKHIMDLRRKKTRIGDTDFCCVCVGNEGSSFSATKLVKASVNAANKQCPNAYKIPVTASYTTPAGAKTSFKRSFFIDTLADSSSISTDLKSNLKVPKSGHSISINGRPAVPQYAVEITLDKHKMGVLADVDPAVGVNLLGRDVFNHFAQNYDPYNDNIELSWSG